MFRRVMIEGAELAGGKRKRPSDDLIAERLFTPARGGWALNISECQKFISGGLWQTGQKVLKLQRENKKLRDRIVSIEDRLDLLEKAA